MSKRYIKIEYDDYEWNEFIQNELINWQEHDIIKRFTVGDN